MKSEETEQIAKLWFEKMWSAPDLSIADEIIDPKYNPSWIQIDKVGPAQIKHEIKYFRTIFPDLKYKIVEMKGEENKVWVRHKGTGTHIGKGWGFEPTKKKVDFDGVTLLYFNQSGKIIDQWSAFSLYDIFADLGVLPPFWELHKHISEITE
ncbi:MAG: ester cyclase [Promethearchaeota archaeon]|jgi:predicted ester cyclase